MVASTLHSSVAAKLNLIHGLWLLVEGAVYSTPANLHRQTCLHVTNGTATFDVKKHSAHVCPTHKLMPSTKKQKHQMHFCTDFQNTGTYCPHAFVQKSKISSTAV